MSCDRLDLLLIFEVAINLKESSIRTLTNTCIKSVQYEGEKACILVYWMLEDAKKHKFPSLIEKMR